jgi:hypothetical protein
MVRDKTWRVVQARSVVRRRGGRVISLAHRIVFTHSRIACYSLLLEADSEVGWQQTNAIT